MRRDPPPKDKRCLLQELEALFLSALTENDCLKGKKKKKRFEGDYSRKDPLFFLPTAPLRYIWYFSTSDFIPFECFHSHFFPQGRQKSPLTLLKNLVLKYLNYNQARLSAAWLRREGDSGGLNLERHQGRGDTWVGPEMTLAMKHLGVRGEETWAEGT